MGTNTNYDVAFSAAKAKWESIIKCGLSDVGGGQVSDWFYNQFSSTFNGPIDDVAIGYSMEYIDGPSNILGFAAATYYRNGFPSPVSGIMKFDQDDFNNMSQNDAEIIILHEMGHILGLVNLSATACYSSCDSGNFQYGWSSGCTLASNEYAALNIASGTSTLQVENGNPGDGQICGHWEESSFPRSTGSSELMTGNFESNLFQPITRVTIAALDEAYSDYVVDYSVADPYPATGTLTTTGLLADGSGHKIYKPDSNFTLEEILHPPGVEPIELPP